jgi:hypothetical protein
VGYSRVLATVCNACGVSVRLVVVEATARLDTVKRDPFIALLTAAVAHYQATGKHSAALAQVG